ncbi:MAG: 4Fe-4S dicluster domain-containing protein, partial [Gammaproteobacteria bacterium]
PVLYPCDAVLVAIGQENAFPWIEKDIGIEFDDWGMPVLNPQTYQSSLSNVFFGGDAAFGPKNIITAVAQGHQAAISIDLFCNGQKVEERLPPSTNLVSQKMGIHEWSYDNGITTDDRKIVPLVELTSALQNRALEVELGFDVQTAFVEAQRCLNCDVQTVFTDDKCIECDACVDICPMDCINFIENAEEEELRQNIRVKAVNVEQALYVSGELKTGKVMVKDEDVCLHCGLCAERCPTAAWDMQQFYYQVTKAASACKK